MTALDKQLARHAAQCERLDASRWELALTNCHELTVSVRRDEPFLLLDADTCLRPGPDLLVTFLEESRELPAVVKFALRIMKFYAHESCGWCIPCREGTAWLKRMLDRFHSGLGQHSDIALIGELSKNMLGRTFCALGDAAAMPTISIVEKFPEDFEAHLNGTTCPYACAPEPALV